MLLLVLTRSLLLQLWGMNYPHPYLDLYNASARAIKSVHPALQVGGPATAGLQHVADFVKDTKKMGIPVDVSSLPMLMLTTAAAAADADTDADTASAAAAADADAAPFSSSRRTATPPTATAPPRRTRTASPRRSRYSTQGSLL